MAQEPARGIERELAHAQRRIRQLERDLCTAQSMYEQSKRALLRNNEELGNTVARLELLAVELRQAKASAEEASVAKSRFLAIVSHEMRTPLNGILGSMELMRDLHASERQMELVQLTHQSARSLLLIINDVLDFSKAEAGSIRLERVGFDLSDCVRGVAGLAASAASQKGVGVELDLGADVPRHVLGDPTRLRQVLLNLTDNAVKFTARGSVRVEVRRVDARQLEFAVRDTGIGIQPAAMARIFEPFTQEDESTTRRFGGTGLGLAICKRIVALMGGDLAVESEVGVGSTFRFRAEFPVAEVVLDAPAAPLPAERTSFPGLRVLLVDDNPINLRIGRGLLERLECEVTTASDGASALELVRAQTFDLVLMDCSMPIMDGFQATAAIRALDGERARVQIVAMTAHAMEGDRERCLAAGMDDYLTKPVKKSDLVQTLQRSRQRHAARSTT